MDMPPPPRDLPPPMESAPSPAPAVSSCLPETAKPLVRADQRGCSWAPYPANDSSAADTAASSVASRDQPQARPWHSPPPRPPPPISCESDIDRLDSPLAYVLESDDDDGGDGDDDSRAPPVPGEWPSLDDEDWWMPTTVATDRSSKASIWSGEGLLKIELSLRDGGPAAPVWPWASESAHVAWSRDTVRRLRGGNKRAGMLFLKEDEEAGRSAEVARDDDGEAEPYSLSILDRSDESAVDHDESAVDHDDVGDLGDGGEEAADAVAVNRQPDREDSLIQPIPPDFPNSPYAFAAHRRSFRHSSWSTVSSAALNVRSGISKRLSSIGLSSQAATDEAVGSSARNTDEEQHAELLPDPKPGSAPTDTPPARLCRRATHRDEPARPPWYTLSAPRAKAAAYLARRRATGTCVSCLDAHPQRKLATLACTHQYCRPCLATLVKYAPPPAAARARR